MFASTHIYLHCCEVHKRSSNYFRRSDSSSVARMSLDLLVKNVTWRDKSYFRYERIKASDGYTANSIASCRTIYQRLFIFAPDIMIDAFSRGMKQCRKNNWDIKTDAFRKKFLYTIPNPPWYIASLVYLSNKSLASNQFCGWQQRYAYAHLCNHLK